MGEFIVGICTIAANLTLLQINGLPAPVLCTPQRIAEFERSVFLRASVRDD